MSSRKSSLNDVLGSRQVIPRWNSAASAAAIGERSVPKNNALTQRAQRSLLAAKQAYEIYRSAATASEYVQTANVLGVPNDSFAVELVSKYPFVTQMVERARHIGESRSASLGQDNEPIVGLAGHRQAAAKKVGALRRAVRIDSDRSLVWVELARQYVVLGEKEKARKAMAAALHMADNNVYIIRCAVRMFTHFDEPDAAIYLLHRNRRTDENPWLMAAEVATSSSVGRSPRYLRIAQDILGRDRTNSRGLSELAAAVATLEFARGSKKRGRELFSKSLVSPTENSLAQAQWSVSSGERLGIPDTAWNIRSSHEAQALAARSAVDFEEMMVSCRAWFADEPFSSRPAAVASTACFDPKLRTQAREFATLGLAYAPNSSMLLNNRAVCYAYEGKLDSALDDLTMDIEGEDFSHHGVSLATLGLLCFRAGFSESGRECYRRSISLLRRTGQMEASFRATIHLAMEEGRLDFSKGLETLNEVRDKARRVDTVRFPELKGLLDIAEIEIPRTGVPDPPPLASSQLHHRLRSAESGLLSKISIPLVLTYDATLTDADLSAPISSGEKLQDDEPATWNSTAG